MRRVFSVHHQKNVFNKDRLWELKVKKNRNIVSENINTRIKYNILSYFFNKKLNKLVPHVLHKYAKSRNL